MLAALTAALARYAVTVAPTVRSELDRFAALAGLIEDPVDRTLALGKLEGEGFNARAGAILATFAPRPARARVARAITALEVLFDLLDGLSERPENRSPERGRLLFAPYLSVLDSVTPAPSAATAPGSLERYLHELAVSARSALFGLPALAAVREPALEALWVSAAAQVRMHSGDIALDRPNPAGSARDPRVVLAGEASSVLVVHVLAAAAADPRTDTASAVELAEAYGSICSLVTLLDGLVDRRDDRAGEVTSYAGTFHTPGMLEGALEATVRETLTNVCVLADAPRHLMILAGVLGYYSSVSGIDPDAPRTLEELRRIVGPTASAAIFAMRGWRDVNRRLDARSARL